MFVDASALTAVLTSEPDAGLILEKLEARGAKIISPMAVWETTVALARVYGMPIPEATRSVERYLERGDIQLVAVPPPATKLALEAFDRYGKGRHPARLNMGDCFAYACSRHFGQPLLYKGDDFALTDIEPA
ncbi:type II toxin-antitoxin system VapC family toxin [Mesorhizobium sp. LHD-90]|uniref:type II toxin-antitoxin system VapC family toxin n=1 Tax=Mesorhizobium sp. LHD-90 TaxID=3071414 RepID=UPI0027E0CC86|nr:type II toxin-antitoxin system VapC family toxin [Mesorhizobium sp. LHD-90]MDQ6434997.1 type II toxin-antitoxin system VapC family toxin [Mesorhizobium sp. LHD-90]